MYQFGNLNKLDGLKPIVIGLSDEPLVESKSIYTEAEQDTMDNVRVPMLKTNEYKPNKDKKQKPIGAAGNKPNNEKDKEAVMGGLGIGGGMSVGKELKKRTMNEGFDPNEVVDEESMKNAKDFVNRNLVIDKVKDVFNDIFDKSYNKAKNKEFDHDSSKSKTTISAKPITKIPKGW